MGCDVDHTIVIYNSKNGIFLNQMKGDNNIISAIQFKDDSVFVTVGPKHYKFWKFKNKSEGSNKGVFDKNSNKLTCVNFDGNYTLCGALNG